MYTKYFTTFFRIQKKVENNDDKSESEIESDDDDDESIDKKNKMNNKTKKTNKMRKFVRKSKSSYMGVIKLKNPDSVYRRIDIKVLFHFHNGLYYTIILYY